MGERLFVSGNEAIAYAAIDCGVNLGTGYPGTPSSEILDNFAALGGKAEWAPNEKVALEVAIGGAFAHGRTMTTMKHVGLNVAADPLFTIAYSGTPGGLVIICADDPGMASSQNEQDNRRYAISSGAIMLEPSDSQEAYDYLRRAFELSEEYRMPVIFRLTTRVCHSKTVLVRGDKRSGSTKAPGFEKDPKHNVMIPAYARLAHRELRRKLNELQMRNDRDGEFIVEISGDKSLGIICNGISFQHVRDAAPQAGVLKIGMSHPLPFKRMAEFAKGYDRCLVVEEGDPIMYEAARANNINVEGKNEMYRFGELNVARVKRIIAQDLTPETPAKPGKPPQLCPGCPHRKSYEGLKELNCIVSGDIGCYTLGVLPPFEAVDTCVCMGASIGAGLGMRQVLPESEARRVVSVIGDSTFLHTGINGIIEMVYNRPATGHVVLILDNSTTAMTGMQEHAGTGRKLDHTPTENRVDLEKLLQGCGVDNIDVIDSTANYTGYVELLKKRLSSNDISVIIVRRPCIIALAKAKSYQTSEK